MDGGRINGVSVRRTLILIRAGWLDVSDLPAFTWLASRPVGVVGVRARERPGRGKGLDRATLTPIALDLAREFARRIGQDLEDCLPRHIVGPLICKNAGLSAGPRSRS